MENKKYTLRYLPLFRKDMLENVNYIANKLQNPIAADNLINDVESAIIERLDSPLSFQPYHSPKKHDETYYRINVHNYSIFYVVIDDVMEVRRMIYNRCNLNELL